MNRPESCKDAWMKWKVSNLLHPMITNQVRWFCAECRCKKSLQMSNMRRTTVLVVVPLCVLICNGTISPSNNSCMWTGSPSMSSRKCCSKKNWKGSSVPSIHAVLMYDATSRKVNCRQRPKGAAEPIKQVNIYRVPMVGIKEMSKNAAASVLIGDADGDCGGHVIGGRACIDDEPSLFHAELRHSFPLHQKKSHWDFVLEEMVWLANDFVQERRWKLSAAAKICHLATSNCQDNRNSEEPLYFYVKPGAMEKYRKSVECFWSQFEKTGGSIHQKEVETPSCDDVAGYLPGGLKSSNIAQKKQKKKIGSSMYQMEVETHSYDAVAGYLPGDLKSSKLVQKKKKGDLVINELKSHAFRSNENNGVSGNRSAKKCKSVQQLPDSSPETIVPVTTLTSRPLIGDWVRRRRSKALKMSAGQLESTSPWSSYEDEALLVLIRDMGQNWELVSDAINDKLRFKGIFRKANESKERHKFLMNLSGDGAHIAAIDERMGSSHPYPSTLSDLPKRSGLKQLLPSLHGPTEENTLNVHFQKIILSTQKQRSRMRQNARKASQVHNSHTLALSGVSMILIPFDCDDTNRPSSNVHVVGSRGSYSAGTKISGQGPFAPESLTSGIQHTFSQPTLFPSSNTKHPVTSWSSVVNPLSSQDRQNCCHQPPHGLVPNPQASRPSFPNLMLNQREGQPQQHGHSGQWELPTRQQIEVVKEMSRGHHPQRQQLSQQQTTAPGNQVVVQGKQVIHTMESIALFSGSGSTIIQPVSSGNTNLESRTFVDPLPMAPQEQRTQRQVSRLQKSQQNSQVISDPLTDTSVGHSSYSAATLDNSIEMVTSTIQPQLCTNSSTVALGSAPLQCNGQEPYHNPCSQSTAAQSANPPLLIAARVESMLLLNQESGHGYSSGNMPSPGSNFQS